LTLLNSSPIEPRKIKHNFEGTFLISTGEERLVPEKGTDKVIFYNISVAGTRVFAFHAYPEHCFSLVFLTIK
jgi:hypothetical protein